MKNLLVILIAFMPIFNAASVHAETSCEESLKNMRAFVHDYQDAAYKQDSPAAEKSYRSAQELMFPLDGSLPDCQNQLMLQYLNSSLIITPPMDPKAGVLDLIMTSGDLFTHGDEVAMVLDALDGTHQVKFLTEKFRQEKKGRWLMKDSSGAYMSTGAYDCDTTTIYVDPTLRPLDEALSIFHDLGHLARDKTTREINPEYIHNGQVDWQAYNLDDEVSGILFSAAAQADLQDTYYKHKDSSNFQVDGDLTFFSNDGLVYRIFNGNHSKPCKVDYSSNGCAARGQMFRARTDSIVAAQLFYSMDQFFKPDQLETYARVRNAIWEAYFVHSDGSETVSSEPPAQPKNREERYGISLDEMYIESSSPVMPYPSPAYLINLFSRQKSYVCSLYEKDMAAGKITRYLGSEFQDEISSEDSVSHAPKSMLKPCLRFKKTL